MSRITYYYNLSHLQRTKSNMDSTTIEAKRIPILTALKNIPRLLENPIGLISSQFEEYGTTYKSYVGLEEIYLSIDADCVQYFMQKGHRNYKKTKFTRMLGETIGRGLLTAEGDYWRQQRRLIQPGFHKKKLEELSNIITKDIIDFSNNLEADISTSDSTDLMKLMMKLTLKVVLNSLYSNSISDQQIDRFDDIITALQHYLVAKVRIPFAAQLFKLNGKSKRMEAMMDEVDEIVYAIIENRKNSRENFDDLLDMLLEARYEDTGEGMTNQQLRDESMIMLLAGHETSANALTWTFYLLDRHPEIAEKVLAEIKNVVGSRLPTFGDLKALTYTKQVIQEAMRLFPPAWITDREALTAHQMKGYKVKKGQIVTVFVYGLHRNPAYWKRPNDFMPERFAPELIKQRHPYSYMPFGGGPRLCIGNNFAYMEMQLTLAILLPKFKFEVIEDKAPKLEGLVTLRPKGGLPVRVSLR